MVIDAIRRAIFVGVVMTIGSIILHQFMPKIPPAIMLGVIIGASIAGACMDCVNLYKKNKKS
jgi:uncharacterized transporter YbjL